MSSFELFFRLGVKIDRLNQKLQREAGVSLAQWAVLRCLVVNPTVSAFSLAEAVGIRPSTLSQGLKLLQRKGLVLVAKDPLDSRRKTISITRIGKGVLDEADRRMTEWEGNFAFKEREIKSVWRQMERLL